MDLARWSEHRCVARRFGVDARGVKTMMSKCNKLIRFSRFVGPLAAGVSSWSVAHAAGPDYVVPVRWCGVREAPTMVDPARSLPWSVREGSSGGPDNRPTALTTDDVLRNRTLNPDVLKSFTRNKEKENTTTPDHEVIAFQPTIPHHQEAEGRFVESFPLLYSSGWDEKSGDTFGNNMKEACIDAWQRGDLLYFDADENGIVSYGDFVLKANAELIEGPKRSGKKPEKRPCFPNNGAPLEALEDSRAQPGLKYGFADTIENGEYDQWEAIYRYFEEPGSPPSKRFVQEDDVLLFPVNPPGPALKRDTVASSDRRNADPRHLEKPTRLVPIQAHKNIKYLDRFLSPRGEFSIGFASQGFSGVYAVSMTDYERERVKGALCSEAPTDNLTKTFVTNRVSGQLVRSSNAFGDSVNLKPKFPKDSKCYCPHQTILVDDHAWMMDGSGYEKFEGVLMAHELGHAMGLPHGDGLDNNIPKTGGGEGDACVEGEPYDVDGIDDATENSCTDDLENTNQTGKRNCWTSKHCLSDCYHKSALVGDFRRRDCIIHTPIDSGAQTCGEKSANMMQDCWRFVKETEDGPIIRNPKDNKFRGKLEFRHTQFDAMVKYAQLCRYGVDRSSSDSNPEHCTGGTPRSVLRIDASDDVPSGLRWLDIGEFGYDVAFDSRSGEPSATFRVAFDRDTRENQKIPKDFRLVIGVNADGLRRTGGKFSVERGVPVPTPDDANDVGADFFAVAEIKAPVPGASGAPRVELKFWQIADGEAVPLDLPGASASLRPLVIPSGSNEAAPVDRTIGQVFELDFPKGVFPLPLEEGTSLNIISLVGPGSVVDVAATRGLRHVRASSSAGSGEQGLYPVCRITSPGGQPLERMPRAGNFVLHAGGLIPNKEVTLRVNGRIMQTVADARTDAKGGASFALQGRNIPVRSVEEKLAVVFAVGAGASTAICGFEFYERIGYDGNPCNVSDDVSEFGIPCGYRLRCEPGKFVTVATDDLVCPDGSLAISPSDNERRAIDDAFGSGERYCFWPADSLGRPNCFNQILNLPPSTETLPPELGLEYNFVLLDSDGFRCNPAIVERRGLDLRGGDEMLRSLCLSDEDDDGIPYALDPCPNAVGYKFWELNRDGEGVRFDEVDNCPRL